MKLDLNNISSAVEQTDEFLDRSGVDARTKHKYRLLVEELLLDYMDLHENAEFKIRFTSRLKKISITILVMCESRDLVSEKGSIIRQNIISGLDRPPTWKYSRGTNIITLSPQPTLPDFKSVWKILRYMAERKKSFVLGVVIRFIQMLFNVLEPLLTARIIVAYAGSEITRIYLVAVMILLQAAVSSFLNYIASRLLRDSYSSMIKQMKVDLTENILGIKTACMDEKGSGVFTQRLVTETANVADSIDGVLKVSTELFQLVSLMIAILMVSPKMFVYETVVFTTYVIIQRAQLRRITDDDRRYRSAMERHTSFSGEMIRAHRDIKLLHCEDSFMDKLNNSINESVDLATDMRVRSMKFILLRTQFVSWTNLIYMALLGFGISIGQLLPSSALILFNYNGRVFTCSTAVSTIMTTLNDLALSSERIYQLMYSGDFEKEIFGETHLDNVKGDIELKNVYYSYKRSNGSTVNVLNGMNLHIRPGEFVAFVGASGCGKSTILSLISRLYDPDSGTVLLDGRDIKELDKETVRGNIQMISQMPYIFNMSIRDNLAVVNSGITEEEMIAACKLACIHDDIIKLPQGYDTVVGEGGVNLSGGQRQRLAIARSFVQDYPVVMFDEATSALDNITQAKIRTAIDNMQGKRTVILIAHRLSTVINCEHLFFVSGGKIIADGTHKELIEKCPEYRALYHGEGADANDK